MPYELYRRSTLGECLTDALDELIQAAQVTPQLAMRVLLQFDKSMNEALAEQVQSRAVIKVGWNGVLAMYQVVLIIEPIFPLCSTL